MEQKNKDKIKIKTGQEEDIGSQTCIGEKQKKKKQCLFHETKQLTTLFVRQAQVRAEKKKKEKL